MFSFNCMFLFIGLTSLLHLSRFNVKFPWIFIFILLAVCQIETIYILLGMNIFLIKINDGVNLLYIFCSSKFIDGRKYWLFAVICTPDFDRSTFQASVLYCFSIISLCCFRLSLIWKRVALRKKRPKASTFSFASALDVNFVILVFTIPT